MRSFPRMSALAIGCLSLLPIAAQQIKPTVQIHIATGQTTFHIGERIPITLTLTGPDNKKYAIDTASYDRSGRLTIDSFDASPKTGWADPLEQYFSRGFFDGGGLRGDKPLSSEPVTFTADLNEQIRFDQPGTYTVTATSHRVGTLHSGNSFPREPFLSILSNPIEIHIIATTPEWQAEKLRSILAILAQPMQHNRNGKPDEERVAATADLRFLNSPAAIEALAANLRDDSGYESNGPMWSAALGLSGVPDSLRDVALHAMSRQLDDPDFPVGGTFLRIMANLEAGPNDGYKELRATQPARVKTVWQLAFSGLARKQGAARAATAETLLSEAQDANIPGLTEQIASVVASTFMALPIDRQMAQLQNNWDACASSLCFLFCRPFSTRRRRKTAAPSTPSPTCTSLRSNVGSSWIPTAPPANWLRSSPLPIPPSPRALSPRSPVDPSRNLKRGGPRNFLKAITTSASPCSPLS